MDKKLDYDTFEDYLIMQSLGKTQITNYNLIYKKLIATYGDVNKETITKFYKDYVYGDYSLSTVRNIAMILNHLIRYYKIEMLKIELKPKNKTLAEFHTNEELELISQKLMENPNSIRDLTIFFIMSQSGLRVSEVVNLNLSDIILFKDTPKIEIEKLLIRNPKNKVDRIVPLSKKTSFYLLHYLIFNRIKKLAEHNKTILYLEPDEDLNTIYQPYEEIKKLSLGLIYNTDFNELSKNSPVFLSRNGGRLSRNHITRLISKAGNDVGIKTYSHKLRHTTATNLVLNKYDIIRLQKLMGHQDIKTTMLYIHLTSNIDTEDFRQYLNKNK